MKLSPLGNVWFRAALISSLVAFFVAVMPSEFGSRADTTRRAIGSASADTSDIRIRPVVENYDIRSAKSESAAQTLAQIRAANPSSVSDRITLQQKLANGEAELRRQVPDLSTVFRKELGVPEAIGVTGGSNEFLTSPSGIGPNRKHAEMVREFLGRNTDLFGLSRSQVSELAVDADYTNPDGRLSYVDLTQLIGGIPVFQGALRAMITPDGAIARVINDLAPGLDSSDLTRNPGRVEDAVFAAIRAINHVPQNGDVVRRSSAQDGRVVSFDPGQFTEPITAELIYFPLEPGVATLAWRISLWEPIRSYYVVVDAHTGALLWLKNTTQDQTQSSTYGVYTQESPGPLSPTNAIPGSGIQGAGVARSVLSLIGNEAPDPGMNNLGWITDGSNVTDGNNVEAGPDIVSPNGVDAPIMGSPNRFFNFSYNPPPLGADDPTGAAYRNGSATNVFYWTNVYHDRLYAAGFTEAAKNFQNDNFGRGGVAGDRISAETPDSAGTNLASFAVQADGVRGRLQLAPFTTSTPNRDPALDTDVFLHELTHGTSGRIIGNGTGLATQRAASLGEGWSDFYARAVVSTADEDVNGVYAMSPYMYYNFLSLGTDNYYYGVRRFPYAVKTTTGGPLNRPHNPLTFADIDPAQFNIGDGAYAPASWIGGAPSEVHNAGEVWCMMLLEVRARLITRMGFAAGNQRMLQLATDAMKVSPLNPDFITGRDAIVATDQAEFGGADLLDIWSGFATRGAGFGALDSGTSVVESFNIPGALLRSRADFDGDGKSDISVVRGGGIWYLDRSTAGFTGVAFGASGDIAVPGDYDGDGKTDEAVFRGGTTWYILGSTVGFTAYSFGAPGDIPIASDYDGDGKTDIAVYRPSTSTFYGLRSTGGFFGVSYGQPGDLPVPNDYDGDGKTDLAVFRPSTGAWISNGTAGGGDVTVAWGMSGDLPVPADYDGDHKIDRAVFRNGAWYILKSSGGSTGVAYGLAGDVPVPGDYDGDGRYDIGVFRNGAWYILQSTAGLTSRAFGLAGDVPVPARYGP